MAPTEAGPSDLTPYGAGGWTLRDTCVFYAHRGRAYLQGMAVNPRAANMAGAAVTERVLSELPSVVRPVASQPVTVLANLGWTWDVATTGYFVPVLVPATVTTEGNLVLDSLPPWLNGPPPPTHVEPGDFWGDWRDAVPDFTNALQLGLLLGTVSWPLADAADDAPAAWVSFAPYLNTDEWGDVDAEIAVHDARVHLRGRVQAAVPNPSALAEGLPADYIQGLADWRHYANSFTRCAKVTEGLRFGLADSAQDSGGAFGLIVAPGGYVAVVSDGWADPTPDDPSYFELPGLAAAEPGSPDAIRGLEAHDSGPSGGSYGPNLRWKVRFPHWGYGADRVGYYSDPPSVWDYGDTVGPCGTDIDGHDIWCPTIDAPPTPTLTLADLFAQWDEPDWYLLTLGWYIAPPSHEEGIVYNPIKRGVLACALDGDGHPVGCGPYINAGAMTMDVTTAVPWGLCDGTTDDPITPSWADTDPDDVATTGYPPNPSFYLMRTDGSGYQRHPRNRASKLLWRASEVESFRVVFEGQSNSGSIRLEASAVPFWERRANLIYQGDTIDLTGAGWQSPYAPPTNLRSLIAAGVPATGLLRRSGVLGV